MSLAGLAHLKPGFCFDAAGDEAFALGWPHVRHLTDEDVDPYRAALHCLSEPDFSLAIRWPRPLAAALVHAWGVGQLFDLAPGSREFRQAAEEAMWNTITPTPTQLRDYVAERLARSPMWTSERATASFVLLLEALVGTEAVVETLVGQLEALDPSELRQHVVQPACMTFQLGFLLLRLEQARADAVRARLRAIAVGAGELGRRDASQPSHLRSLWLVLDGAAAADRYTDKDPRFYLHAVADGRTVRVRASLHRGWSLPDPRLVWLGGGEVLATPLIQRWAQLPARDQRWFAEAVAPIRHPGVVALMVGIYRHGHGLKSTARKWLLDHRAFAAPILTELAAGGSDDARAVRAALEVG